MMRKLNITIVITALAAAVLIFAVVFLQKSPETSDYIPDEIADTEGAEGQPASSDTADTPEGETPTPGRGPGELEPVALENEARPVEAGESGGEPDDTTPPFDEAAGTGGDTPGKPDSADTPETGDGEKPPHRTPGTYTNEEGNEYAYKIVLDYNKHVLNNIMCLKRDKVKRKNASVNLPEIKAGEGTFLPSGTPLDVVLVMLDPLDDAKTTLIKKATITTTAPDRFSYRMKIWPEEGEKLLPAYLYRLCVSIADDPSVGAEIVFPIGALWELANELGVGNFCSHYRLSERMRCFDTITPLLGKKFVGWRRSASNGPKIRMGYVLDNYESFHAKYHSDWYRGIRPWGYPPLYMDATLAAFDRYFASVEDAFAFYIQDKTESKSPEKEIPDFSRQIELYLDTHVILRRDALKLAQIFDALARDTVLSVKLLNEKSAESYLHKLRRVPSCIWQANRIYTRAYDDVKRTEVVRGLCDFYIITYEAPDTPDDPAGERISAIREYYEELKFARTTDFVAKKIVKRLSGYIPSEGNFNLADYPRTDEYTLKFEDKKIEFFRKEFEILDKLILPQPEKGEKDTVEKDND